MKKNKPLWGLDYEIRHNKICSLLIVPKELDSGTQAKKKD